MASESCIVLSAFVALHVAFVLNVTATASTYWVEGHVINKTQEEAREGLWNYCNETACGPIPSYKSPWFISVLVLYPAGAVISLLATVLYYMFCMTTRGRQSKSMIGVIATLINLSWMLLLAALAVYGSQSTGAVIDLAPPRGLGWAYFVATAGLVFTFVAAVCATRELCIIVGKRKAYIDL